MLSDILARHEVRRRKPGECKSGCRHGWFVDGWRLAVGPTLMVLLQGVGEIDHEHGKTPISTLAAELGQRTLSPHMSPAWRQAFMTAIKRSTPIDNSRARLAGARSI